jgi:hypothetical protein
VESVSKERLARSQRNLKSQERLTGKQELVSTGNANRSVSAAHVFVEVLAQILDDGVWYRSLAVCDVDESFCNAHVANPQITEGCNRKA